MNKATIQKDSFKWSKKDDSYYVFAKKDKTVFKVIGTFADCEGQLKLLGYRPIDKFNWIKGMDITCEVFDYENNTPPTSEKCSD